MELIAAVRTPSEDPRVVFAKEEAAAVAVVLYTLTTWKPASQQANSPAPAFFPLGKHLRRALGLLRLQLLPAFSHPLVLVSLDTRLALLRL